MVQRIHLSKEIISKLSPPQKGEKWISDTEVKGFGLRLWSTKYGCNRAFALRTIDKDGKAVRATFDPFQHTSSIFKFLNRDKFPEFEDYLQEARQWAKDKIAKLKGLPTETEKRNQRDELKRQKARKLHLALSFYQHAMRMLDRKKQNGCSQNYTDRLDQLFTQVIPKSLQDKNIAEVTADEIAEALLSNYQKHGNVRSLKTFIAEIFNDIRWSCRLEVCRSEDIHSLYREKWYQRAEVRFPELNDLKEENYEHIFQLLENEKEYWQQALCIRLYFEFRTPLTSIMSAKWSQIYDQKWYPYWPNERVYWLSYETILDDNAIRLLKKISELQSENNLCSEYWFPSKHSKKFPYIRTVDHVWCNTLHDIGSHYYPLKEYVASYGSLNQPSYYINFLKQYGSMLYKARGGEKLEAALMDRKNKLILNTDMSFSLSNG